VRGAGSLTAGFAALAMLAGTAAAPAAGAACRPDRVDLGVPAGALASEVIAFGPHGEAGGGAYKPTLDSLGRALLWTDGLTIDLGSGEVTDINARGDVLIHDLVPGTATVVSSAGARRALRGLRPGDQIYARRINDRGDVAGASFTPGGDGAATPVIWRAGRRPVGLPVPTGYTGAYLKGIDDAGDAVGAVQLATGDTLAASWDRHRRVTVLPTAFPQSPWDEANVVDVHGDVLGATENRLSFAAEATLWKDGHRIGLGHLEGALFGVALGTDGHADVVGFDAGPDRVRHAWVIRLGGRPQPLTALSGGTGDASMAHAVRRAPGGDVTVGGASQITGGEEHATIWRCAFHQATAAGAWAPRAVTRARAGDSRASTALAVRSMSREPGGKGKALSEP